jgi:hypothetical protein
MSTQLPPTQLPEGNFDIDNLLFKKKDYNVNITNTIIVSVGLGQWPSAGNRAVREGDPSLRLLALRDFVATLVF